MIAGILGAGAWGTALAIIAEKAGNDVILWSYDGSYAEFDGVNMPIKIKITKEIKKLSAADVWLVSTPAAHFRKTLQKSHDFYRGKPVIICTKGMEPASDKIMSEILAEELPECLDFGVLSGPQFAKEVAQGLPTGSTLAGTAAAVDIGKHILNKLYLEISDDIIGTEICGIGKNAIALISGYSSIKASGENEKALIFTRAWNEVVNLGLASGAKIDSFLGLCGIGDLFLSATSKTSRNYSAGVAIATNTEITGTIEGIQALNSLINRAADKNISMPVLIEMKSKMKI
ncbi:MAG: hypothetical protein LBD50_01325 [Rickettsiales bacterium]|jgi:glycerol-3-phosphate dehydrogenase (NAD(P)+)|nr:hypothetical protein [Rickettsiales bacterium]